MTLVMAKSGRRRNIRAPSIRRSLSFLFHSYSLLGDGVSIPLASSPLRPWWRTWNDYPNPMRDAILALLGILVIVIVFWFFW
jgi:hypothetical protein